LLLHVPETATPLSEASEYGSFKEQTQQNTYVSKEEYDHMQSCKTLIDPYVLTDVLCEKVIN